LRGLLTLHLTTLPIFYDREKAKKRVYELNGWKYNERTQTSSAR
jgi:hypothetical protein